MAIWTFEGYWNAVLGADRDAADVVREFALTTSPMGTIDEWLGKAESEAWAMGRQGGSMPGEWADHHSVALAQLEEAAKEAELDASKAAEVMARHLPRREAGGKTAAPLTESEWAYADGVEREIRSARASHKDAEPS